MDMLLTAGERISNALVATAVVSEPPRPKVVTSRLSLLTPWKPATIQISGEKVKDIIAVADPGVIEEIFGGSQPIDIVLGELTGLVGICDGF